MKEELLDDSINIGEEEYLFLQELQKFPSILNKLAIVLSLYIGLDVFLIFKELLTANRNLGFLYMLFRLLINGALAFVIHAVWQQKKLQEETHKIDYKNNEAIFIEQNYKAWYFLGVTFLLIIIRSIVFIFLY